MNDTERLDDLLIAANALLSDPVMKLVASPDRHELHFMYGHQEMVVIGVDEAGLALVARTLKIGRVRRTGRRGARRWTVEPRDAAQLPKPPFPYKGR